MPLILQIPAIAALSLFPLCPSPHDKDGWGLRINNLSVRGPYFTGERIGGVYFDLLLLNHSNDAREYDPLVQARESHALLLTIIGPDGKALPRTIPPAKARDPFTQSLKLRAGEGTCINLSVGEFGYHELIRAGRYRLELRLEIGRRTLTAPSVAFEVVKVPAEAVLASHTVPLEGWQARKPPEEQDRAAVQQIRVGKQVLLVYRRFSGIKRDGGAYFTARLAELPGKVELSVAGAYGDGKPLTIKFKNRNSKTGATTLVINSITGMPWTEEEERLRIERNKKRDNPASQPTKP